MSEQYPPARPTVVRMALFCLLAGVLTAGLLFPFVGGAGVLSNTASESVEQDSEAILDGDVPAVSTMVDAAGNTIAWIYLQRRFQVPTERIADTMKLAIVSIEDKRFAEHNGVDLQGTLTGLAGYLKGAVDTRGGSTIEQQYVKNFNLLVNAIQAMPDGGVLTIAVGVVLLLTDGTASLGGIVGATDQFRLESWIMRTTSSVSNAAVVTITVLVLVGGWVAARFRRRG